MYGNKRPSGCVCTVREETEMHIYPSFELSMSVLHCTVLYCILVHVHTGEDSTGQYSTCCTASIVRASDSCMLM